MTESLSLPELEKLRLLVAQKTASKAAKELGVSRTSILAILAGQAVHDGTIFVVRARLEKPLSTEKDSP